MKNNLNKLYSQPIQSSQLQGEDYIQINNATLLRDKSSYYSTPDKVPQETIPVELKQFIIDKYNLEKNSGSESNNCFKSWNVCPLDKIDIQVVSIDLNNDGIKEYIVLPIRICDCTMRGASGNGDIFIVKSTGNILEVIGELFGNNYYLSKNKSNGYQDILTNYHYSASSGSETLYQFQITSSGDPSNKYEQTFSKWYDTSRTKK